VRDFLASKEGTKAVAFLTYDWLNPNPKRFIGPSNFREVFDNLDIFHPVDRGERQLVYYPDPNQPRYTMAASMISL
jgi:hypothetical protein